MASSTISWARCLQSVVWAKKRAVSIGDQNSGLDRSCSGRIGGGWLEASGSDPVSSVSSLESFSSLSSSSTDLRLVRSGSSWRWISWCRCCWTLEFPILCGEENFRLTSGYFFSFAPLANRPRFRTSRLGELARLVVGVRSESSSVGVVECWPKINIKRKS